MTDEEVREILMSKKRKREEVKRRLGGAGNMILLLAVSQIGLIVFFCMVLYNNGSLTGNGGGVLNGTTARPPPAAPPASKTSIRSSEAASSKPADIDKAGQSPKVRKTGREVRRPAETDAAAAGKQPESKQPAMATPGKKKVAKGKGRASRYPLKFRAGHFRYFLSFSIIKNDFFTFCSS